MGFYEEQILVKADLHNYAQTDNVINECFERIANQAQRSMGENSVVGIVEVHEERYSKFKGNTAFLAYEDFGHAVYLPSKKVLVLRGVRTFTQDDSASILAFGIPENRYLPRRKDIGEMIQDAHEKYKAVIIAPQSQRLFKYLAGHEQALRQVDAVETFNGSYSIKRDSNNNAKLFHDMMNTKHLHFNLGSLVTSGGHSISEIGRSWTLLPHLDLTDSETLKESLREAIKLPKPEKGFHKDSSLSTKALAYIHAAKLKFWWALKSKERKTTLIDGLQVAE
ncbi:MAG: hypothetical protein AABX03_05320 [Nanoarchaeota archaeon]